MAYIQVEVDIDSILDEASTDELIQELKYRFKTDKTIRTKIKDGFALDIGNELSLIGKMKLEVIIKKIDDKTLEEIEQFFK